MSNELDLLKKVIYEVFNENNIEIEKIILFGSRARGDSNPESDWDFLIITNNEIDLKLKREIRFQIRKKLSHLSAGVDLIIKSVKETEECKNDTGIVAYYAVKEGIAL